MNTCHGVPSVSISQLYAMSSIRTRYEEPAWERIKIMTDYVSTCRCPLPLTRNRLLGCGMLHETLYHFCKFTQFCWARALPFIEPCVHKSGEATAARRHRSRTWTVEPGHGDYTYNIKEQCVRMSASRDSTKLLRMERQLQAPAQDRASQLYTIRRWRRQLLREYWGWFLRKRISCDKPVTISQAQNQSRTCIAAVQCDNVMDVARIPFGPTTK